jgi:hypothetical protein
MAGAAGEPRRALAAGPFAQLAGEWNGGGTIRMASGDNERIRCRVRYAVDNDGNDFRQDLRCASDSYRFDLTSQVQHRGGAISGNWAETTRGVGGQLSGRASGSTIQALAESTAFSANLVVSTRGNTQSVTIRSPGSDVREVSMTLRKGR